MPRSRSLLTGFPVPGSASSPTHTLRTPSSGAIQASRRPSGEMRGVTRSGLPNSTERGTRGTEGTSIVPDASGPLRFVRPISRSPPQEDAVPESAYVLIQTEVGKAAQVASEIAKIQGIVDADDVTG